MLGQPSPAQPPSMFTPAVAREMAALYADPSLAPCTSASHHPPVDPVKMLPALNMQRRLAIPGSPSPASDVSRPPSVPVSDGSRPPSVPVSDGSRPPSVPVECWCSASERAPPFGR